MVRAQKNRVAGSLIAVAEVKDGVDVTDIGDVEHASASNSVPYRPARGTDSKVLQGAISGHLEHFGVIDSATSVA